MGYRRQAFAQLQGELDQTVRKYEQLKGQKWYAAYHPTPPSRANGSLIDAPAPPLQLLRQHVRESLLFIDGQYFAPRAGVPQVPR